LQDTQQLCLHIQGQLADLIEEDGSTMRLLEATGTGLNGPGECASDVAEEFRLDQVGWNCAAIDSYKRSICAVAGRMNGSGGDLFTGTCFTCYENRRASWSRKPHEMGYSLHRNA
jgi:hypothetical protein